MKSLAILSVPSDQAPLKLLALADPSTERVRGYLPNCTVFVGQEEGATVAVAAVQRKDAELELMSIAVAEAQQGRGIGRQMLAHVVEFAERNGATHVTVGTGNSSIRQLAFYQQSGFKITGVIKDYFKDYDPPIFENGIRCLDMVLLSLVFC